MGDVGKHFWWKMVGIVVGLGVLGLLFMLIFNRLIYRFGAIAALVLVFVILMAIAYRSDKKKQHQYDEDPA